jgi:hypothetical protein
MNTRHPNSVSRRQAEALVDAPGSGPETLGAPDSLQRLLAAATARATPTEIEGEAAALSAFRARGAAGPPATAPTRRRSLPGFFTSKVIAIFVAGGVATGGVAYAASSGHLPGTPSKQESPAPASASSSVGVSASGATTVAGSATAPKPTTSSSAAGSTPTRSVAGPPDPSLTGLCNAYESGAAAANGKALSNPAFSALVAAAGGIANVDAYCARLGVTPKHSNAASSSAPAPSASTKVS